MPRYPLGLYSASTWPLGRKTFILLVETAYISKLHILARWDRLEMRSIFYKWPCDCENCNCYMIGLWYEAQELSDSPSIPATTLDHSSYGELIQPLRQLGSSSFKTRVP